MRVPEYIKQEMRRIASYAFQVNYRMKKVEAWLEKHGVDPSTEGVLRDGSGLGLEELEYGEDITEELCERIELMLGGEADE